MIFKLLGVWTIEYLCNCSFFAREWVIGLQEPHYTRCKRPANKCKTKIMEDNIRKTTRTIKWNNAIVGCFFRGSISSLLFPIPRFNLLSWEKELLLTLRKWWVGLLPELSVNEIYAFESNLCWRINEHKRSGLASQATKATFPSIFWVFHILSYITSQFDTLMTRVSMNYKQYITDQS